MPSAAGAGGRRRRRLAWAAATLAVAGAAFWFLVRPIFWSVGGPGAPERLDAAASAAAFTEVTAAAGFTHVHHKPHLDAKLAPIMPWVASVGAAAAAADFDGDGWMDLYVTDSDKGQPNRLYRNNGDGTFTDVAARAGVALVNDDTGTSMDCVWGDYDNDGRPDLYVVKWGRDRLFRNAGDGTFADVTDRAFRDGNGRPGSPWANGCAAVWFDYDGDGFLDLYVGNYFAPVDLWNLEHTRIMHDSFEQARNAGRNFLFHNERDGTFTEVGARLGMDDPGWTLGVGHGDLDNDGWPDLYVANDFGPDQVFLNRRDGTFRNVSDAAIGNDTKKGMNVDFGDFDNDGWLDVYVTNITTDEYLKEGNMLWHNDAATEDGIPVFLDVSVDCQAFDGGWGWGAKWWDFDNDGDLDVVSANGFITAGAGSYWFDLASWTVTDQDVSDARNWPPIGDRSFSGNEPTRLWRNEGNRRFVEVAARAGVADRRDGRGAVVFDHDNDGDLDLYLANQGAAPAFFRNDVGAGGNWLELRLKGRPEAGSNRDAIGARVTVATASGRRIRELDGGNSFCGQSDRRLHFGLGPETVARIVEIRWPSRRVQVLRDVRANRILEVEEPAELEPAESLVPATRSRRAAASAPPPEAAISAEEKAALLGGLEDEARRRPEDLALASRYRLQCIRLGAHERAVAFFDGLVREHPTARNPRLQLAAAYVDRIPTCGGMAAVVSKGTLARRSLDQIDILVAADPDWWPAVYARAMNHLHWPRALGHSADAARDFRRCLELQSRDGPPGARSHHVRAHVGLGDALAKEGDLEGARAAWSAGLDAFPADAGLRERLALKSAAEARDFVERARNLERQIDTDFSFLLAP